MHRLLVLWVLLAAIFGWQTVAWAQDTTAVEVPDSIAVGEEAYEDAPLQVDDRFIDASKNLIYGLPASLTHIFEQLRQLEQKKDRQVHILHIGDSHIQADIFSGMVRRKFQEKFQAGGRGFVFPYRMAQSNNPYNYRVAYTGEWIGARSVKPKAQSRWGLAGVTATTYNPKATFTVNPNAHQPIYEITHVKVFFPVFDKKSYRISLRPEPGNHVTSQLTSGNGYVEFTLQKPQRSVTFVLEKTAPTQKEFVLQGLSLDNRRSGVVYSASGVNGAEVKTYFRCEDFQKHLTVLRPDLVIISLGTNDAVPLSIDANLLKSNYIYLINKVRAASPKASILLTTPGDSYRRVRYVNKNNEKVREIMFEVATETGVAIWDFYTVMGGFRSIDQWHKMKLSSKDKLHLSGMGYKLQGKLLYDAFERSYAEYCRYKKGQ